MNSKQASVAEDTQRFSGEAERLYKQVIAAIDAKSQLGDLLNSAADAVYIKSSEGQIVVANDQYEKLFAGAVSAVGRFSSDFLNETIKPVSHASDLLILSGCTRAEFSHPGKDIAGRSVRLQSFKRTLLGAGHPRMAIFGITRIMEVIAAPTSDEQRSLDLSRKWVLFQSLDSRDRGIAVRIAHGQRHRKIATDLGVSEKTIDNRRAVVLGTLKLDAPLDLVKLMVRLQDNGFADFGL